jgi:hypothetical protein
MPARVTILEAPHEDGIDGGPADHPKLPQPGDGIGKPPV